MLNPELNRLDYGNQLQPPDGYKFDAAIATTYSVDLNTLLAVPIALSFGDTLEGELKGEKLALFEAFGQLKNRLKVFYQKGNVAHPPTFNRLFTLLEPCLQAVIPEGGAFSSFHPKVWLIRYLAKDDATKPEVKYRLIVLSRNLTMDRSWDIAVSLDGVIDSSQNSKINKIDWITFVESLLDKTSDFEPAETLKKELPTIRWETIDSFDKDYEPELIIGGGSFGRPIELPAQRVNQIMVVSPFISKEALNWLASSVQSTNDNTQSRLLFSRAEELDSIGQDALKDWQCFSMNKDIVSGEERGEFVESKLNNLHAKIIITRKRSRICWHLGSANATNAALGTEDDTNPRNTEVMIKLQGIKSKVGPDILIEQWVKGSEGLFVEHEFQVLDIDEGADSKRQMRELEYSLISADWKIKANISTADTSIDNLYDVNLLISPIPVLDKNVTIEISQLAIPGKRNLNDEVIWKDVQITNISGFIPVTIYINKGAPDELIETLIIEADVKIEGGDIRHQKIFKGMVDSEEKILNYFSILLQLHPDKDHWLSLDKATGTGDPDSFIFTESPIFEHLLWAASRHPHLLKRIQKLIDELNSADVDVPENFSKLWGYFRKELL